MPESHPEKPSRIAHRDFYRYASADALRVRGRGATEYAMIPGRLRNEAKRDTVVGRHQPPSSPSVEAFMHYFESRYRFEELGRAGRIAAIAAPHHRLNYIHPFPDGNGRVSRLMSHAMGHAAGIRRARPVVDLARPRAWPGKPDGIHAYHGCDRRTAPERRRRPRHLSRRALIDFTLSFLRVCLDQIRFMRELFELESLERRLRLYVLRNEQLGPRRQNYSFTPPRVANSSEVRRRASRACRNGRHDARSPTSSRRVCSHRRRRKAPSRFAFRHRAHRSSFPGSFNGATFGTNRHPRVGQRSATAARGTSEWPKSSPLNSNSSFRSIDSA